VNLPHDKCYCFIISVSLEFRHSVDVYSSEVAKLSCRLLEFMAKGMGAEPASLLGMFEGQPQGMRMNYYPPCWQADQVLGLSPHSDACGLTILLQKKDVQGLQVKRDGKWFAVDALDGALIVNVGDVLEILSNGKFRSAEHRAVIHQNTERISVAVFHQPCQDLIVGPLPEFVKGDKVRYRSTSYRDFLTQFLKAKLDGKNHLEKLKL
jgi:isopenicillin N synthase-like dioxygenase